MLRDFETVDEKVKVDRLTTRIAAIQDASFPEADNRLPVDKIDVPLRDNYRRHEHVGLNVFLLEMFGQFPDILGVAKTDYMTSAANGEVIRQFFEATDPKGTGDDPDYRDQGPGFPGQNSIRYRVVLPRAVDSSKLKFRATLYDQSIPPLAASALHGRIRRSRHPASVLHGQPPRPEGNAHGGLEAAAGQPGGKAVTDPEAAAKDSFPGAAWAGECPSRSPGPTSERGERWRETHKMAILVF